MMPGGGAPADKQRQNTTLGAVCPADLADRGSAMNRGIGTHMSSACGASVRDWPALFALALPDQLEALRPGINVWGQPKSRKHWRRQKKLFGVASPHAELCWQSLTLPRGR